MTARDVNRNRFVITSHAVERYVKRVNPAMPIGTAAAYLRSNAQYAAKMREKTPKGEDQYKLTDPEAPDKTCVLVVKRRPDGMIVVTVLGPGEFADDYVGPEITE